MQLSFVQTLWTTRIQHLKVTRNSLTLQYSIFQSLPSLDLQNYMVTKENQLKRCYENRDAWLNETNDVRINEAIHTLATIRSAVVFIEEMASKETHQV